MIRPLILLASHALVLGLGFALGIYALPLLVAPTSPTSAEAERAASQAEYTGQFRRDLEGSDILHWGEGTIAVGPREIAFVGKLAPGPDYKVYLSPAFVETETEFQRLKPRMVRVGDVRTFENFIVPVNPSIDISGYDTVVVWCEAFDQFITAARYRE